MPNSVILPIRFGVAFARGNLSERTDRFYTDICREVLSLSLAQSRVLPICFFSDEYRRKREVCAEDFRSILSPLSEETKLYIDVGGPAYSQRTDYNIFLGLCDALSELTFDSVIILANEKLFYGDHEFSEIADVCEKKPVGFVFRGTEPIGRFAGVFGESAETIASSVSQVYQKYEAEIRDDNFARNILRVPGAFRFDPEGPVYPHYYSFEGAQEVHGIIHAKLHGFFSVGDLTQKEVFVESTHNSWFREAVESVATQLGVHDAIAYIDDQNAPVPSGAEALLLVPVVRSRISLKRVLRGFEVPPEVWCLARVSPQDQHPKQVAIPYLYGDHEKTSILSWHHWIEDSGVELRDFWEGLDCPFDDIEVAHARSLSGSFSASTTWAMILESGLAPETYGPRQERPLAEIVPNFAELTERNLNFLVAKFRAKIRMMVNSDRYERLVYLSTDEPSAQQLTHALSDPDAGKGIQISRALLDELYEISRNEGRNTDNLTAKSKSEFDALVVSLDHLRKIACSSKEEYLNCINIDEFHKSGTTLRKLREAANFLEVNVLGHISLFSLDDDAVEDDDNVQSFYSLPLPQFQQ